MKNIAFILLLFGFYLLHAQDNGFIQAYSIDDAPMSFNNLLVKEDTLIVCGAIKSSDTPQWGLLFAKLDTLGTVLDYKTLFDNNGVSYIFEQEPRMIATQDKGFLIQGIIFTGFKPILIKLDALGNKEWVKIYPDNNVATAHYYDIIETEHGYISIGTKQQTTDYKADGFVMYTNKQGEKIWEVGYGEYGLGDFLNGITPLNDNLFLVSGGTVNSSQDVGTLDELFGKSIVFTIDTLGNIINEWESPLVYTNETPKPHFRRPIADSDNSWVTLGSTNEINTNQWGEEVLNFRSAITKRNLNYEIVWETFFGQPTSYNNKFIDLTQAHDGGWIAAGQYLDPDHHLGGMLAKVSADGDSLWSRIDVGIEGPDFSSTNFLSSVGVLSSGSIVAAGHTNDEIIGQEQSYGWIIKVDKDGCIEPGCHPTLETNESASILDNFIVSPNPASTFIDIKGQGSFFYTLYNTQGIRIQAPQVQYDHATIEVEHLPRGIYFLKIQQNNTILTKKIVLH